MGKYCVLPEKAEPGFLAICPDIKGKFHPFTDSICNFCWGINAASYIISVYSD